MATTTTTTTTETTTTITETTETGVGIVPVIALSADHEIPMFYIWAGPICNDVTAHYVTKAEAIWWMDEVTSDGETFVVGRMNDKVVTAERISVFAK